MDFNDLRPVLSGLAGAAVVYVLARVAREPSPREGSTRILRFGQGFRVVAVLLVPGAVFVVYAAAHARPSQALLAATIATAFILGSAYLAFVAFFVSVSYDEQNIYYERLLSGKKVIPWTDVKGIGYSRLLQAHYIETGQVRRIWVSSMMQGFDELGDFLEKKHVELYGKQG